MGFPTWVVRVCCFGLWGKKYCTPINLVSNRYLNRQVNTSNLTYCQCVMLQSIHHGKCHMLSSKSSQALVYWLIHGQNCISTLSPHKLIYPLIYLTLCILTCAIRQTCKNQCWFPSLFKYCHSRSLHGSLEPLVICSLAPTSGIYE